METNQLAALITGILLAASLLGLRGLKLSPSSVSRFELKRRASSSNLEAAKSLRREETLSDIIALRQALEIILSILVALCFLYGFGWGWGTLLSLVILLGLGALAQLRPVSRLSGKLYRSYEQHIQNASADLRPFLRFMPKTLAANDFRLGSIEEAEHLLLASKTVFSENERLLLANALKFGNKLVSESMTPAGEIETIKHSEVLGPIMLDRLHKSGQAYFPVVKKDVNHVVGLLSLDDALLRAKTNAKTTAAELMQSPVFYLNEAQNLPEGLSAFLRVRTPLFIVVNEHQNTTGLITLSDIIKAMFGRSLNGEFDQYDDLGAVSKRKLS